MLTDIRSDKGIAASHLPQFFDHRLRLNQCTGTVVLQAIAATPLFDLRPPLIQCLVIGLFRRSLSRSVLIPEPEPSFFKYFWPRPGYPLVGVG